VFQLLRTSTMLAPTRADWTIFSRGNNLAKHSIQMVGRELPIVAAQEMLYHLWEKGDVHHPSLQDRHIGVAPCFEAVPQGYKGAQLSL
jgi:hypothetical protein